MTKPNMKSCERCSHPFEPWAGSTGYCPDCFGKILCGQIAMMTGRCAEDVEREMESD